MPHFTTFSSKHYDYQGLDLDSHDRNANIETSYLLDDGVDEADGEIIVPDVYVEEIALLPPVGASARSSADDMVDTFVFDAAEPVSSDDEPGLPGVTIYLDANLDNAPTVGAAQSVTVGAVQTQFVGVDDALF